MRSKFFTEPSKEGEFGPLGNSRASYTWDISSIRLTYQQPPVSVTNFSGLINRNVVPYDSTILGRDGSYNICCDISNNLDEDTIIQPYFLPFGGDVSNNNPLYDAYELDKSLFPPGDLSGAFLNKCTWLKLDWNDISNNSNIPTNEQPYGPNTYPEGTQYHTDKGPFVFVPMY